MNYAIVCRSLGLISLLIGGVMLFSLPWAYPPLGHRGVDVVPEHQFEYRGFAALAVSIAVCLITGLVLLRFGRSPKGHLYRKEALAVVGLSWILATVLGALPFYLSGTYRCAGIRLAGDEDPPLVYRFGHWSMRRQWEAMPPLTRQQQTVLQTLLTSGAHGVPLQQLRERTLLADPDSPLRALAASSPIWQAALVLPDARSAGEAETLENSRLIDEGPYPPPAKVYAVRWVKMGVADALFESQSGFSTTGATVIADLEDPILVPHCILFWRSSTHFLGGLGIIVLFVTILGQGAAGKALMRAEMPGPTKEAATARMQHTAWLTAAMYCGLNAVLALLLMGMGLSLFDALCHAFGTMATGGFSTYNASLGYFQSAWIDYTVLAFMLLAGSNFTLLYLALRGHPLKLLQDPEWRTYLAVVAGVTILVVTFGLWRGDFPNLGDALRYGSFQVVSIMTTTGYGTHDFDNWNSFGRGALFLLMFVGGCAGSTAGGLKVIRHILFLKILGLEIERAYRPTVVRPLRLAGEPVGDQTLRRNVVVYFALILVIFVFSWMFLVTVEPDETWGVSIENKLIDCATGIAATLNNIGPGLGTVGATQNYTLFSPLSKFLFVWLMMIGRLEIFAILVLFTAGFWKSG